MNDCLTLIYMWVGPRKVRSSDLKKHEVKSFPSQLERTKANGLKHSFPIHSVNENNMKQTDSHMRIIHLELLKGGHNIIGIITCILSTIFKGPDLW